MGPVVTVSPTANDLVLVKNQTIDEVVKVTIARSGVSAKVDVYFLADTTSSMGSAIEAVKKGISEILAGLGNLGADVWFGVGEYKDFPAPDEDRHPYAFRHQQSVTDDTAAVMSAIATWQKTSGRDQPEAQLYALDQVAEPPYGSIGWRADAARILVWFGDAPGHDPIYQRISNLRYDVTESSVTARLVAEGITTLALSVGTNPGAPAGLDDDPQKGLAPYWFDNGTPAGTPGQGTRIATATGGAFVQGVSADTVVNTITERVKAQVTAIGNVRLVPVGDIAQFVRAIQPAEGHGPLARDQEHELPFDVSWAGTVPESDEAQVVFKGALNVVADGKVVGAKSVKITVPDEEETAVVRPDDVSGKWMLVHQVTGTYIWADSYQYLLGNRVRTWCEDPFPPQHAWAPVGAGKASRRELPHPDRGEQPEHQYVPLPRGIADYRDLVRGQVYRSKAAEQQRPPALAPAASRQ